MQTKFEVEASNLRSFRANFPAEAGSVIRFPEPLFVSSEFLVLTREEGEELSCIFRNADLAMASSPPARSSGSSSPAEIRAAGLQRFLGISPEVRGQIATESVACYMQMVFKDNFVHGDLHPGNVLLRLRGNAGGSGSGSEAGAGARSFLEPLLAPLRRAWAWAVPEPPPFELVVLDAGLAMPLPPAKVEEFRRLTVATLYADYAKAANLLFQASPDTTRCESPEEFKRELECILRDSRRDVWDQGFLQLSGAGLKCLDLVQRHHVHLDVALSWAILALLSVEGSARQLDPCVDATGAATRFIITARSLVQELSGGSFVEAKEMLTQMTFEYFGLDFWAFRNWRLAAWNKQTHYDAPST